MVISEWAHHFEATFERFSDRSYTAWILSVDYGLLRGMLLAFSGVRSPSIKHSLNGYAGERETLSTISLRIRGLMCHTHKLDGSLVLNSLLCPFLLINQIAVLLALPALPLFLKGWIAVVFQQPALLLFTYKSNSSFVGAASSVTFFLRLYSSCFSTACSAPFYL